MNANHLWALARNQHLERLFLYGSTRVFGREGVPFRPLSAGPITDTTMQVVEQNYRMGFFEFDGNRTLWLKIVADDGTVVETRPVSDSELTRYANHIYERY